MIAKLHATHCSCKSCSEAKWLTFYTELNNEDRYAVTHCNSVIYNLSSGNYYLALLYAEEVLTYVIA